MDQTTVQLEHIIQGILTPDQTIHQQAQDAYYAAEKSNPSQLVISLATILKSSAHHNCRVFAAVILRQQSFPNKQLFDNVDPQVITAVKQIALDLFQNESNFHIRRKVIEFAAVFASRLFKRELQNNPAQQDPTHVWPELLSLTFMGCKMADMPEIQKACFAMIDLISEYCIQALATHQQALEEVLAFALQSTHIEVQIAASIALLSILVSTQHLINQWTQPGEVQTPEVKAKVTAYRAIVTKYAGMVPQCCAVFAAAVEKRMDGELSDLIDNIENVIEMYPESFSTCFPALLQLLNKICRDKDIDEAFRGSCLNLLTAFSSTPQGRTIARNSSKTATNKKESYENIMLALSFDLLQDIEDSAQWQKDPSNMGEDEEEFPNHYLGLYLIRSLPTCLGLKTFLPTLLKYVLQRAANIKEWRVCHAALAVFKELAEEHLKSFPKESIPSILSMLTSLVDPKVIRQTSPRVGVALFESILAFSPKINQKTAKLLVPALLQYITPQGIQSNCPTLLFYLCRALSAQISILQPSNLAPFAQDVLHAAVNVLSHPNCPVKNTALGTISLVAHRLGDKFNQYADHILAGLCTTLQQINGWLEAYYAAGNYDGIEDEKTEFYQQHTVKNKIIESIAFIAEALGKELFIKYVDSCMVLISKAQELELRRSSPYLETIFVAFNKISEAMEEAFAPYLPSILPGILQAASAQNFSYRFDLDQDENLSQADQAQVELLEQRGFSSLIVGIRGEGLQKVMINSSIVQDKIRGLEMLGEFAVTLKDAFTPYLEQVANVALPECTTRVNPRLRWAATTTVPAIFECYLRRPNLTQQDVVGFLKRCIESFDLPKWVENELPQGMSALLNGTCATLDALVTYDPNIMPVDLYPVLSQALLTAWNLCLERRLNIEADLMNNPDEEHAMLRAESMSVENQNLDACVALNTQLLRCNVPVYFPFFAQHVEPLCAAAIDKTKNGILMDDGSYKTRDPYLFTCGSVAYADIIAHSGALATDLIPKVLPIYLTEAANPDSVLRRAVCYGLAVSHRNLTMEQFAPFLEPAFNVLLKAATMEYEVEDDDDGETEEENSYALDNVLSGLSDMISRYSLGEALPHTPSPIDPKYANPALQNVIQQIIPKLPRFHDEEESRNVHRNYVIWLKKIQPVVFGENNVGLAQAVRIYANLCDLVQDYDVVFDEDMEYLKQWYEQVKASVAPQVLEAIKAVVDPDFHQFL